MKSKPNMYRVNYRVMEGNNYAGGWGNRSADVESLADAGGFSEVQSVVPIFIEIGDPIADIEIQNAINARKDDILKMKKERDLVSAEEQLRVARAAMNN